MIYEQSLHSSATPVCQLFSENRPPQFTPLLWLCTLGIQQMKQVEFPLKTDRFQAKSLTKSLCNQWKRKTLKEIQRPRAGAHNSTSHPLGLYQTE